MRKVRWFGVLIIAALFMWFGMLAPQGDALAHCDSLDGPVAMEAKVALEKGDITPLLKWVKKEHEHEVTVIFKKTMAVRSKGAEVQEIADRYFLENLIRIHRAGEGAPFTGLKPAGSIDPIVAAVDKGIETGKVDSLAKEISHSAEDAVRRLFGKLMEAKRHKDESADAGREYVEAYVTYVHFVEELHGILTRGTGSDEHGHEKTVNKGHAH